MTHVGFHLVVDSHIASCSTNIILTSTVIMFVTVCCLLWMFYSGRYAADGFCTSKHSSD